MKFEIVRQDGRSNAQVLLDYFKNGMPGRVYTHAELADVLSAGTSRRYAVRDVRAVVAGLYTRLLKEQQRAIHSVRGLGYRLAYAKDQSGLALTRKRRSDVQLKKGLETLQHVAWHELDPDARKAHEGTLMVVGALWANQQALERRQSDVERAISNLTQRVEEMSAK